MVTYTVKPGREEENAVLVRAVFDELAETRPTGLRYAVFYLPDSRQFIHLYTDEGSTTGVQGLDSFKSIRSRSRGSPRTAGHLHPARTNRRLPHIRRLTAHRPPADLHPQCPPADMHRHSRYDGQQRRTEVMRKLIESTLVSLDGVIGSPDSWSPFDEESRQLADEELENYDALVLGRVTYEFFRANWGAPTGDPYIDHINAIPKYVASRTLSEVTWNATLLGPDIVGAIQQLKAQPGKDLFKMGTGRVDDTLLRARLVDELRLWVMPVVVGTGQRLFEDVDTSSLELTLTDVRKLANSSVILTYVPS
jgi:dihydrofolate reductase